MAKGFQRTDVMLNKGRKMGTRARKRGKGREREKKKNKSNTESLKVNKQTKKDSSKFKKMCFHLQIHFLQLAFKSLNMEMGGTGQKLLSKNANRTTSLTNVIKGSVLKSLSQ